MQITNIVLTTVIVGAPAIFAAPAVDQASAATSASASAADVANNANQQGQRELQACGDEQLWHPVYSAGWTDGYCREDTTCDSPGYSTELACCKAAYGGQMSGACLKSLPNPPTSSPTNEGGLDVWYPDYGTAWTEASCLNDRPLPSGRPTYDSPLACCKGAYGGQASGACLESLPSPPTTSPTGEGGLDFWYPDYDKTWSEAGCLNERPFAGGRPTYSSQLACCKAAYGGQQSGACIGQLPSPPTTSPTMEGGLDEWYPDLDTAWSEAACINDYPLPSGRPTYTSQLACCKGAYAGQQSGACIAALPSPPTTSPTGEGGLDEWYPDYDTAWPEAGCLNERPLPSGRPTYTSQLACCKAAYGAQSSGACIGQLPSPPTTSPTMEGGLDEWYPDLDTAWSEASCINDYPLPSGRPTYTSQLACCKGAYAGQQSGACIAALPSPPTTSPTGEGGLDEWYPDYDTAWPEAGCLNERPLPSGRPTYTSQLACCKAAYGAQSSGACIGQLPSPPTTSPTMEGGLSVFYPDYDTAWSEAACINDYPLPSGRPTYTTLESCCSGAYGGQTSQACMCVADPLFSCNCPDVESACYATDRGALDGAGPVDNSANRAACEGTTASPTGNFWTTQGGFECE